MAFTSTERAQIRFWLGYSDVSQGGGPNRLETAMTDITASAETLVRNTLTALTALDTELSTVATSSRAGIIEVDNGGVKWESGSSAPSALASRGRTLVARLSSMFGVLVAADVFGAPAGLSGGPTRRG